MWPFIFIVLVIVIANLLLVRYLVISFKEQLLMQKENNQQQIIFLQNHYDTLSESYRAMVGKYEELSDKMIIRVVNPNGNNQSKPTAKSTHIPTREERIKEKTLEHFRNFTSQTDQEETP